MASDPFRGVRRTITTTNASTSVTTADSTTTTTATATQHQRPSHRPLGSSGNMSSLSSLGASSISSAMAGAADEDMFLKFFEAVPRLVIYSGKDVVQELTEVTATLSDTNKDWEKRVDALKRVRSLILAGGADFDEFFLNLKPLELAFLQSVRDLRSKVVRETCITIAFMSQSLRNRVDRFMEGLMPALFNLIPNSAKIMSTSGVVCIRFVIEYTHSPRLIPVLCSNMSSKAKEGRKACCEFLHQMMYTWPTHSLEKHMVILQEAIKKGMSDADPEARGFSRKAFWGFAEHFKDQADGVLHSLDPQRQKALYGELGGTGTLSNSNSTHSLSNHNIVTNGRGIPPAVPPRPPLTSRTTTGGGRSVSSSNSVENLSRPWSAMSGSRLPHNTSITTAGSRTTSKIPVYSPKESALDRSMPSSPYRYGSAIDVGAARRARARAVIASAMANPNSHSHNAHNSSILSRSVIHHRNTRYESPIANAASAAANAPSSERQGRSNGRVSQSQPGSRSTSPSSFLSPHGERSFRVARKSSIPTASSRDPSPAPSRTHITDRSHRIRRTSDTPDSSKVSELDLKLNNSDLDRLRRSSDNQELPRNGRHATPTKESRPVDAMSEASGDGSSVASGDHCLDVLKPVIGELPSNQAAIKMLTKLVEQQPKSVVSSLLPDMMPALIQAYDSPDIAVRKAAVFAMVAINNVVGMDDLKEYLVSLNGSKMKLLNLYIERSKSSLASAMTTTSASSTSSITSTSTTTNNTNGTYETPT